MTNKYCSPGLVERIIVILCTIVEDYMIGYQLLQHFINTLCSIMCYLAQYKTTCVTW